MRVLYIAEDGTPFDNEWDCYEYEWKMKHSFDDIEYYLDDLNDPCDYGYFGLLSQDVYKHISKVVVKTEDAVKMLNDLVSHTGFINYAVIDSVGTWIWDATNGFRKEGQNAEPFSTIFA